MDINNIRQEYLQGSLERETIDYDPFTFLGRWLNEAIEHKVFEPTAMSVSTIGDDGFPQSRIVLLKSFDSTGLVFYTNFTSQKGKSIIRHPQVALLFFWPELERQIRITGMAKKVDLSENVQYFASRPRVSQIGAWASEQSSTILNREYLEKRVEKFTKKFANKDVPTPEFWGGFRVEPVKFEFWQGRENRLNDRFQYSKEDDKWLISRLAP